MRSGTCYWWKPYVISSSPHVHFGLYTNLYKWVLSCDSGRDSFCLQVVSQAWCLIDAGLLCYKSIYAIKPVLAKFPSSSAHHQSLRNNHSLGITNRISCGLLQLPTASAYLLPHHIEVSGEYFLTNLGHWFIHWGCFVFADWLHCEEAFVQTCCDVLMFGAILV